MPSAPVGGLRRLRGIGARVIERCIRQVINHDRADLAKGQIWNSPVRDGIMCGRAAVRAARLRPWTCAATPELGSIAISR